MANIPVWSSNALNFKGGRILIQTLKDYGYVEHIGMDVRNKIIRGMLRHNGTEPDFEADDMQLLVRLKR